MNYSLLADYLQEDYFIPKTGERFSHLSIENSLNPEIIEQFIQKILAELIEKLKQVAIKQEINPGEFIFFILPEIVKELNGYSPHKQIGF